MLVSMFAILSGCCSADRDFDSSDADVFDGGASPQPPTDAGPVHVSHNVSSADLSSVALVSEAVDAGATSHALPDGAPTRPVEAGADSTTESASPVQLDAAHEADSGALTDTTQEHLALTCNPTASTCGEGYCSPDVAQCVARTDAREEGTPCTEHTQCTAGLACGYIGDPQLRQLACLRLGRSDLDCGGSLGRLTMGVGLTPLVDDQGDALGLCVGDIR